MSFYHQFIQKAARFLYRERSMPLPQTQLRFDRQITWIFSTVLFAVFGLFAWYFMLDAQSWFNMKPQVQIERSEWQVLVDPSEQKLLSSSEAWAHAAPLTNAQVSEKIKSGAISQLWLKLSLSEERIKTAAELKAYYFRLGFLIGDVKVWLNDEPLVSIPSAYTGNIDVALPISKVEEKKAMTMIINMTPREGAKNVVPLTLGVGSGLVAYKTGAAFMRFNHFINRSRPLALFFIYSVFSLIFFTLWHGNRVQREYLHLAVYALVTSLPPLMFSDSFTTGKLRDGAAFSTYLILVLLQGGAGLSLGLSFARSHSRMFGRLIWGFISVGAAAVLFLPLEVRSAIRQPLNQILMPTVFFIGAAACFIQARWLSANDSGLSQPVRVRRLNVFMLVLSGLGVLYYVQFHANFEYVTKQLLFDFPAMALVMLMGYLALIDYRQQSRFFRSIPISDYHRRNQLPEKISGLVMMIDLKNSESYFSFARHNAGFENVMPTVLSHIWTAVNNSGGVVLRAEGDELIAFFDESRLENPLQNAFEASDRIQSQLKMYSEELRSRYDGLENQSLHFRAAVAGGELKPTWVEGTSGRLPGWIQLGSNMIFVEASRLLEIEKQLAVPEVRSHVLMQSFTAEKFHINQNDLRGNFIFQRRSFTGKHGAIFVTDVYDATAVKQVALKAVG